MKVEFVYKFMNLIMTIMKLVREVSVILSMNYLALALSIHNKQTNHHTVIFMYIDRCQLIIPGGNCHRNYRERRSVSGNK